MDQKTSQKNITLYYLMTIGMSCWFIATNWIYFWTKYMTFGQLGWVDALGFGFSMLLEIPSGAIADMLGKRRTIIFGTLAGALGVFIITFSGSFWGIFVGWMIAQFSYAFFSGAGEALAYDSLKEAGNEKDFDKVISKSVQIQSYTSVIVTVIGGFLFTYSFRLPHILWGSGFLLAALAAYLTKEPKVDSERFSFRNYINQLTWGVRELFTTRIKYLLGFFFATVAIEFMYAWGFIRPAMATDFGFFSREQGIIFPVITLTLVFIVRYIPTLRRKISDSNALLMFSVLMAASFIFAAFPVGYFGLIALFAIPIAGNLSYPWMSVIINEKIESKYRATTLSTLSMMMKLPYVLVAVIAGKMIEQGRLPVFNLYMGIVILVVAVVSFVVYKVKYAEN